MSDGSLYTDGNDFASTVITAFAAEPPDTRYKTLVCRIP